MQLYCQGVFSELLVYFRGILLILSKPKSALSQILYCKKSCTFWGNDLQAKNLLV